MKAPVFLLVLAFPILFAVEQRQLFGGEIIHEDFDDGDFGDDQPGKWVRTNPWGGPNIGILDASSGDLVMDTTRNNNFMWAAELRSVDGESLGRHEGWSIRTLMTLDEGDRAGVGAGVPGTAAKDFAAVEWFSGRQSGGLIVGFGAPRNTVYFDDNDPIYGEDIYVQLDVFDDLLTGYVWRADDPSQIISLTYDQGRFGRRPVFTVAWGIVPGFEVLNSSFWPKAILTRLQCHLGEYGLRPKVVLHPPT